ncbi:hypothetical protein [Polaribacter sp. Hel_I_88]|uniref:hypothetical protein n=1 Tax=Polaribacter sp. Hel_I_88 TaxID=1250006 RepID=UPI000479820A|nr:hypothetical protein [Polaribacter sp. Hel_I_88]
MDLQADLKWIHKELEEVKDVDLIKSIKDLLEKRKKTSLDRIDVKQYNTEIETSLRQVEEGAVISHENLGEKLKQWSKK